MADLNPATLLQGEVPRLIGEWQLAPKLWDAVVHLKNGRYGLIEIKLGGDKMIEEGATNLIKLKEKIDSDKMHNPSFMMVLCGVAPFAYKRSDGVMVVPIGCLRD